MDLTDELPCDGSSHAPRDPSRPPRIIVAEDDPGMLDVVEERDGGRLLVRVAAIYTFGGTVDPIDLIVSDICMPVCSGLDILQGLRDAHWSTPVILMTALRDDDVRRRATNLGASLLEKPVRMADLLAEVKALLSSPRNLGKPSLPAEHKQGPGSTGTPRS